MLFRQMGISSLLYNDWLQNYISPTIFFVIVYAIILFLFMIVYALILKERKPDYV